MKSLLASIPALFCLLSFVYAQDDPCTPGRQRANVVPPVIAHTQAAKHKTSLATAPGYAKKQRSGKWSGSSCSPTAYNAAVLSIPLIVPACDAWLPVSPVFESEAVALNRPSAAPGPLERHAMH